MKRYFWLTNQWKVYSAFIEMEDDDEKAIKIILADQSPELIGYDNGDGKIVTIWRAGNGR